MRIKINKTVWFHFLRELLLHVPVNVDKCSYLEDIEEESVSL